MHAADPGSFKDPVSRVYHSEGRVLRALSRRGADVYGDLEKQAFFVELCQSGKVIHTSSADEEVAAPILREGWKRVLEHQRVPFVSYPYEWPFAMLKDAALLHLEILLKSAEAGWTLKDATPYNIQWMGSRPVFIDIPSWERREDGAPWAGYRQFCMTFLFPLMLRAHLNIDYAPLLRSNLDGVPASEILRYFSGRHLLKKGVLPHVVFPAFAESASRGKTRKVKQPKAVFLGLIRGLQNTINRLSHPAAKTMWTEYEDSHSYTESDIAEKQDFVRRCVASRQWSLAWDLGCNAGMYSSICRHRADYVVGVDGDEAVAEKCYLLQKSQKEGAGILSLTMNLSNMSPGQGWGGKERAAFTKRAAPDLVLCLALIHHLRIGSNIPLSLILDELHGLNTAVIIEFVGRDDDMTRALLEGKSETYDDYNVETFEKEVNKRFLVKESVTVKDGMRKLYFLHPLNI